MTMDALNVAICDDVLSNYPKKKHYIMANRPEAAI